MAYRSVSFGGSGGSSSGGQLVLGSSGSEAAAPTKPILAAAALLEREIELDERSDRTLEQLTSSDNGLYQFDARRLQLRRTVPIPQAIIDEYDQLSCKSFVGLFPEIARAYITIDNKLFLWNYHDGANFMCYDELSQIIVSVALLRPKPGVFVDAVEFVLAVATPVEVLLFALVFEDGNVHSPLQLFPTQFTIPSDNTHMVAMVGTDEGRILLAGKDGGIYELDYWGQDGSSSSSSNSGAGGNWIGAGGWSSLWSAQARKKCRKVAHCAPRFRLIRSLLPGFLGGLPSSADGVAALDQQVTCMVYDRTRHLLYTLASTPNGGASASAGAASTKTVLSCFSLGHNGWSLSLRSKKENLSADVRASLRHVSPQYYEDLAAQSGAGGSSTVYPDVHVVSLFPVPRTESDPIVLLAVTSHGHRIYFDLGEDGHSGLRVRFVRLCPPAVSPDELNRGGGAGAAGMGGGMRASSQRVEPRFSKSASPSLVHTAYYKDGILLLADAGRSALGDTLVAVQREAHVAGSSGSSASSAYTRSWNGSASSSYAASAKLLESLDAFDLDSRIAELSEVAPSSQLNLLSSALFSRAAIRQAQAGGALPQPLLGLSELATQHVTPPRHFLILTSSALLTLSAARPLDDLRHALSVLKRTSDETPLLALLAKYGAKELGAMCLILVCAPVVSGVDRGTGTDVVEVRSPAPGGNGAGNLLALASPDKLLGADAGAAAAAAAGLLSDEAMRKLAKQAFFRVAELAQQQAAAAAASMGMYSTGAPSVGNGSAASGVSKVECIALYVSRWLRSHWDWSLCVPAASAPAGSSLPASSLVSFRFGREYYVQLLQPLLKLQRFLQENQRALLRDAFATPAATPSSVASPAAGAAHSGLSDPSRAEAESLSNLSALLNVTIEVFHLLLLFLSYANSGAAAAAAAAADLDSVPSAGDASGSGAACALLHASPFLSSSDLQHLRDFKFLDIISSTEGHALVRKLINTLAQYGGAAPGTAAGAAALSSPRLPALGSPLGLRGKRARPADDDFSRDDGHAGNLIAQLHTACPTFFGASDLLYFNGLESLSRARASWHLEAERELYLQRALDTFASFLNAPSFPLEEVAAKLKQVHQYEGSVALTLRRAQMIDQREVVCPPGTIGANALAQHYGGSSTAASGTARSHEEEFYAHEKKRCLTVLLDTLSALLLGKAALGADGAANGTSVSRSDASTDALSGALSASSASSTSAVPSLSSESLSRLRARVLSQVLSSPDPSIHAAVYGWFIEKGFLVDLYAVQNEHVVRFLASHEDYVLLLKDYYLANERWWEAARLLNSLALTKSDRYTLEQRSDFLARSLLCARNYQQQLPKQMPPSSAVRGNGRQRPSAGGASSSSSEVLDFIQQLQDRFDIAAIQLEIYQQLQTTQQEVYSDAALRRIEQAARVAAAANNAGGSAASDADLAAFHSKRAAVSSALSNLDHELLDLQSLYHLASSLSLWESCLRIFAFSGERARSDVIAALWKNILRAPMAQCKRLRIDWADAVASKVIDLASSPATNYKEQEFLFPLPFLLKELETYNVLHRSQPDAHFVADTMLAAGVAPARLLQAYETLLDSVEQAAAVAGTGGAAAAGAGFGDDSAAAAVGAWDVHRANARGQTVQTFLFYSIHHLLTKISEQESVSGRRGGLLGSSSAGAASAAHLINECVTSLRTLPPSEDTARLAKLFQQITPRFARG